MNSVPATNTEFGALCAMLQLGDTFYPTGAYSHSQGLEGLIEEGIVRDRDTLREYCLASILPSLARVELPLVRHAYEAFAQPDWAWVAEICALSSAVRATREARQASNAIGKQRVALVVSLRGFELAKEFQTRAAAGGWSQPSAVASALEARALGADVRIAMAGVYYGACSTAISAAMKLLRIGQNGGQSLLTELLGQSDAVSAQALRIGLDEIGWFNPWLDIASARHEHAPARLFIS